MAASIANTFFWQWDKTQSDKCELAVGLIKTAQQLVQMSIMEGISQIGFILKKDAAAGAVAGAEMAGKEMTLMTWAGSKYRNMVVKINGLRKLGRVARPGNGPGGVNVPNLRTQEDWTWKKSVPYPLATAWDHYVAPKFMQILPSLAFSTTLSVSHLRTLRKITSSQLHFHKFKPDSRH